MSLVIVAPWAPELVTALNAWQACDWVHPFTCASDHAEPRNLVATADGWRCPSCAYRQEWAHSFMLKLPPDPRTMT